MHKWILPALLAMFFLSCYAVGFVTIASTVRTKIKALRVRRQYRQAIDRINSADLK